MSTRPDNFSTFNIENGKSDLINYKSLLRIYRYHWLLFIISIVTMVILGLVYLQLAQPQYEIKASLLIPQIKTPQYQQQSVLDKIDLPAPTDPIENDVAKLKSTILLRQVIKDLQLSTTYKIKDGILNKELYASIPFRLIILKSNKDVDEEDKSFKINLKENKLFSFENTEGQPETHSFKDSINSNWGTWKLVPTAFVKNYKNSTVKVNLLDSDKLVITYQKKIDVNLEDKNASAIELKITDNNKQRGKDILNHLITAYDNAEIAEKNKETQSTIDFINQRLASLTGELTNAEKNIADFKSANQLTDIASDTKFNLDNVQANDAQLNQVNVQLSVIDNIESYINSPKNKGKIPAAIGIADPNLNASIGKLSQLQLEHDQLLATTPETNPDFEQINNQIQTTRDEIKENVKNIKSSLFSARNKLQAVNSHFESSITNIPSQEREYISIKRQQSIKENLYIYLLQKREEVSLSYAATIKNYRVLDNAYSGPISWPNKLIVLAAALFLGLLIPVLLIYLKNIFKNAITNPEEVDMPILAELNINSSKTSMLIDEESNSLFSEQFRSLRTKLYYLHTVEQSRVTLITSSIAGEGKSYVSSNLSSVQAFAEKKTVLLELDLRQSKIVSIFKLSTKHAGITDFLNNKASINEIIQRSNISPTLDVIGRGSPVSNPAELLESEQLKRLISELRKVYDEIIIDSPPIRLVTDAMILSRYSDITLYIVRQGLTKKSELKFINDLHKGGEVLNMHIIFNGVDNKKYGYGYEFDNSYYRKEVKPI